MPDRMWMNLIDEIRDTGISFDSGLSDSEIASTEKRYGFTFPADLRAFLQSALPLGERFPNWRSGDEAALRDWLDQPRQGILFDIEHNGFWLEEWGSRPPDLENAQRIANRLVAAAPQLVPVFAHRMIPTEPNLPGNPVFSVHQTDIIVYGIDLRDYLIHEFLARGNIGVWPIPDEVRTIPFWDIERFQEVRWGSTGTCVFDNSRRQLP